MAEVKILVKGYTTADNAGEEEKTGPTITLVRDKGMIMVVDPGVLESPNILIDALKKEGLTLDDVNVVFVTHSHIDHYRNVGMFPNAKVIEYYGIWYKNMVEDRQEQLTKDIKIIETPGHNYTSLTLLIQTNKGKIAICGDVFWKENYPKKDEYADNPQKLKESRKKILDLADFIIPGHAGIFKVQK